MGGTSPLFATATPTPNAIPIADGSGTLNLWVGDGSGGFSGGSYAPVTTGAEPVELVSDGAGSLIMTPFTP